MQQAELIEHTCPDCKRHLPEGAKKCRCGWKANPTEADAQRKHIPCDGLPDCTNSAVIRIGNANVCQRCYRTEAPRLRAALPREETPAVRACREAYERSRYARRARELGHDAARAEVGAAALPRAPGED